MYTYIYIYINIIVIVTSFVATSILITIVTIGFFIPRVAGSSSAEAGHAAVGPDDEVDRSHWQFAGAPAGAPLGTPWVDGVEDGGPMGWFSLWFKHVKVCMKLGGWVVGP